MTLEEAVNILKKDRELCLFNPMTGECKPMNEDCRQSAEALDVAIKALGNVKGHWDVVEMRKDEWWHTCSNVRQLGKVRTAYLIGTFVRFAELT